MSPTALKCGSLLAAPALHKTIGYGPASKQASRERSKPPYSRALRAFRWVAHTSCCLRCLRYDQRDAYMPKSAMYAPPTGSAKRLVGKPLSSLHQPLEELNLPGMIGVVHSNSLDHAPCTVPAAG